MRRPPRRGSRRIPRHATFSSPAPTIRAEKSVGAEAGSTGFVESARVAAPHFGDSQTERERRAVDALARQNTFGFGSSGSSRMDGYYRAVEKTHAGRYNGVYTRRRQRTSPVPSSAATASLEVSIVREERRNIELRRMIRERDAARSSPKASAWPVEQFVEDDAQLARATIEAVNECVQNAAARDAFEETQVLLQHTQGEVDRIAEELLRQRARYAAAREELEAVRGSEAALALIAKELLPTAVRLGLVPRARRGSPSGSPQAATPPALPRARGVVPIRAAEELIGTATALFIPDATPPSPPTSLSRGRGRGDGGGKRGTLMEHVQDKMLMTRALSRR